MDHLKPGATFEGRLRLYVPAGKGVNTARSLSRLIPTPGSIVSAIWVGRDEESWFRTWLKANHGLETAACPRRCGTRSAYTIMESSGRETHIKESMSAPNAAEQNELKSFWAGTVQRGDSVSLCGSAPSGTSRKTLAALFKSAHEKGACAIIADTSGVALDVAAAASLYGIKGNASEIGTWLNVTNFNLQRAPHREILKHAFARRGAPKRIVMTLGGEGAALATQDKLFFALPASLTKKQLHSTTGCGDAATAGWLWAIQDECSPEDTLRRIVCCGTAKATSDDPGDLNASMVTALLKKTRVIELV